jgi:undecaprenyl diphosphate synthase
MYGFSTENWNRPKDEIDTLFNLFRDFIKKELEPLLKKDIKFIVSGDYTAFPADLVEAVEGAVEDSKNNNKMVLNLCINYGGKPEIVRAVNNIIKDGVKVVDEQTIQKYLYTAQIPDPARPGPAHCEAPPPGQHACSADIPNNGLRLPCGNR